MTKKINIVVLHDWLDKFAGAEKVLEQILKIYPKVDLFTIVDHMEKKDRKFLLPSFLRAILHRTTFTC